MTMNMTQYMMHMHENIREPLLYIISKYQLKNKNIKAVQRGSSSSNTFECVTSIPTHLHLCYVYISIFSYCSEPQSSSTLNMCSTTESNPQVLSPNKYKILEYLNELAISNCHMKRQYMHMLGFLFSYKAIKHRNLFTLFFQGELSHRY